MRHTLHYVHDPMCSWCWGFSSTLAQLTASLPDDIALHRVLGGLAKDTSEPMPHAMREHLQSTWRRIELSIPGTIFNHAFWTENTPLRSTYPACRAVIAAREQDSGFEAAMINAIQTAYYRDARNPSDATVLVELSESLGCDKDRFELSLDSDATQAILMQELRFAQRLGATGFPSLFLESGNGDGSGMVAQIPVSYNNSQQILDRIELQRAA